MEELKEWLRIVVSGLVYSPEEVNIKATEDEQGTLFLLTVSKEDTGRIIGKSGVMSENLRTLLRAAGYIKDIRVSMKIDSGYKSI